MRNNESAAVLLDALKDGEDVHSLNLYRRLTGSETNDTARAMSYVYAYISRLNKQLEPEGRKVVNGSIRGSYRLMTIPTS